MSNRLKAYVRKTILNSAKEYAYPKARRTKESTLSAFRDASQGTDSGWWNDLIYTQDVLKMFNRYRSDCASVIGDYMSDAGVRAADVVNPRKDDQCTFADMLVACAARKPITWEMYKSDDSKAIAATLAICFSVEELTHRVASEMEVEL